MEMTTWDKRFMDLAKLISSWSKDPSTKCGTVVVDLNKRIVSVGYNGYACGVLDTDYEDREKKYEKVIHAEVNAILFANKDITGCRMYNYPLPPCSRCMSVIIQSGITQVYFPEKIEKEAEKRWAGSNKLSMEQAFQSGCRLIPLNYEE